MTETERTPAAQVEMARKAAALVAQNKQRKQNQQGKPQRIRRGSRSRLRQTARLQDNSNIEASDGDSEDDSEDDSREPDSLVPDRVVGQELGTTVMSLWRRTNDPDDGFPPPIKIRGRNFRSRKALEAYKARKLREAMRVHKARLDVRRRDPVPVSPVHEPSRGRPRRLMVGADNAAA